MSHRNLRTSLHTGLGGLLLLVAGCFVTPPPTHLAVWSEFLPYEQVRRQLPTLAAHDAAVYVAVTPDRLGPTFWELCRQADLAGVELRPWLQLPDDGTWLNERNISAFAAFADALLEQAETESIRLSWLIFDLEPDFATARALRTGDPNGLPRLIRQVDRPAFVAARAELRQLVERLQARDLRVMVATLPWTLDDQADGDATIQDLFDTPLDGIPWDEVTVMTYRPFFIELFGLPLSAEFVTSYARTARDLFGQRAGVAVGNVGTPGLLVPRGYSDLAPLLADVAAARLAGVDRVSVFSLDGMVLEGGAERWLRPLRQAIGYAPRPDLTPGLIRGLIGLLDQASDLLGGLLGIENRETPTGA